MDTLNDLIERAGEDMRKAFEYVDKDLRVLQASRVFPGMLEELLVDYHGVPSRLKELAHIGLEANNQHILVIKPWEKDLLPEIEKGILQDNQHNFSVRNSGEAIYASRPPLTEESRKVLVKQVASKVESGKVAIRNIRKKYKGQISQDKSENSRKQAESKLEACTTQWIGKLQTLQSKKAAELMQV